MVFSDEYQEVIEATPEIKYKVSIIVKVLVGFLALLFILLFVGALFSALGEG